MVEVSLMRRRDAQCNSAGTRPPAASMPKARGEERGSASRRSRPPVAPGDHLLLARPPSFFPSGPDWAGGSTFKTLAISTSLRGGRRVTAAHGRDYHRALGPDG